MIILATHLKSHPIPSQPIPSHPIPNPKSHSHPKYQNQNPIPNPKSHPKSQIPSQIPNPILSQIPFISSGHRSIQLPPFASSRRAGSNGGIPILLRSLDLNGI